MNLSKCAKRSRTRYHDCRLQKNLSDNC